MNSSLQKWAEEMGVNDTFKLSNKKLALSDYKLLTKGADMTEIWTFVIKHVSDVQTVKAIRGNLALYNSSKNTLITVERDMLKKKKINLMQEIATLRNTLQPIRQTTSQLATEILNSEQSINDAQSLTDNYQITTNILGEFIGNARSDKRKYTNKCKEVQTVLSTKSMSLNKGTVPVLFEREMPGTSKTVLETACMRNVRESCEHIERLLLTFANEMHVSKKSDQLLSKKRKMLFKSCMAILKENTASDVLKCLNDLQRERTQILKDAIDKLDVKKDAKNLQFHYTSDSASSECLQDLQSCPDVLKDIKTNVIVKFVKFKMISNSIQMLSTRRDILINTIPCDLQKIFPNEPDKVNLTRLVMESDMRKAFGKAYFEALESAKKKLTEEIENNGRMFLVMMAKYEDIKNLHDTMKTKQEIIRSLITSNAEYEPKLQDQIQNILEFISNNIEHLPTKYISRLKSLQNTLSREVELFVSLPLSAVVLIQHDGLWSFSPYLDVRQLLIVDKFNEVLGITGNQPPENFLASAIDLKFKEIHIRQVMESQRDLLSQSLRSYSHTILNAEPDKAEVLTDLKNNVEGAYKQQILLCDLSQQEVKLDKGCVDCRKLLDVIKIWENLPAGEIVLPVTVAGLNLKQFKENLLN